MSDKNSSLINLPDLPDSIDNAVKNLTDKPTQGVRLLVKRLNIQLISK